MRISRIVLALACVRATFPLAAQQSGRESLEISRYTMVGGGAVGSTAGLFELSGTIGQPDAAVMTGDDLELSGGFWFALAPTDCNEDGIVNLFDYEGFTDCLAGPDGVPPTGCECFDVDRSGSVDLHDFAEAQMAFAGT